MYRETTRTLQTVEWNSAAEIHKGSPAKDWTQMQSGVGTQSTGTATSLPAWLNDPQDRRAYLESCLEQDVAWQIRLNREARGISQAELAAQVGTRQSSIARAENPSYGKHSLSMLTKIAHAFGCALLVRFVSYQELIERTSDTSPESMIVAPNHD
jgi:ribosome-binding protein aMBF1 (putative translation factor)